MDSFREMHPNPVAVPGNTWSPIYEDDKSEPMDRIDFIYHKGMTTVASEVMVLGKPKGGQDNEWPSDHAAVLSTFKVPSKRSRREAAERPFRACEFIDQFASYN
ncbi:hypothetical protein VFPPC_14849 [Pochonia chlamydosporia 170]|uniref:Endonuclease/exonuclease/phosphatase domain-containing protein n=1 Tax=Pochonia chlamydosporia 170 TaxID=1380566 RepID=A0A179EZV4_METCM|nr:hypothetical protein VFPPC_14849 [Pochonia chlamydosporia 170]OAQ58682.1 hypothetical protein VFPPC_14849 [Pochonia chlamydosporia 170]